MNPRQQIPGHRQLAELAREDLKAAERDALVKRSGFRAYGGRE